LVLEDLSKLFFETIPNDQDIQKSTDAIFEFFSFLDIGLQTGVVDITERLGFEDLLRLFQQGTGASEDLLNTLRSIPEETKVAFNEFFNSYDQRLRAINKLTGEGFIRKLFPTEEQRKSLLQTLLEIEDEQSKLFKERVDNGFTELQILELSTKEIREKLGLDDKIKRNLQEQTKLQIDLDAEKRKGTKADQGLIASLEQRIELIQQETNQYSNLVELILEGVVRNNKFRESIEASEKAFEKQGQTIRENQKLIDATFDPEQLRKYFSGLGDDLETIFPTLILDLESYLERFGQAGTEAIIQGVIDGLREQGKLTRQEAEKIIDVLEKAGLALKAVFGFAFDPFAEQLKMLRKLIKGLADESRQIPKAFINLQEVTEDYFQVLGDLSGRLEQVIAQNNANLLDQLEFEQQAALAQIGEANAATQRENDRINAERLATEKRFAQLRFDIEKKARVQELQFALASAIADGAQAIINALATIPPPLGAVYAAGLGVLTGAQIQVINNQLTTAKSKTFIARRGGLISGGSHEQGGVPALLEGGEFIVNREAVAQFGNIISDLNSSTGGRKLAIDDSRLVQAIASQNQTSPPLKAYVLYNSIQDTEKLNRKITNLSRL
jgi:hypothetical protein